MSLESDAAIDPEEIARFAGMAARWWDPEGEAKPLHRLNPVRLQVMRERLTAHFGRSPEALRPFTGMRLLDIGCGAGLVAEPMARLGFAVTGIDGSEDMVTAAYAHAALAGLGIEYRAATAEGFAESGAQFDTVLALEIVEHVPDPEAFLAAAARLVAPGGVLILSTLNRTARAFLLGIVAAEHLLRWVPRGTHDWRRFRRPSELAQALRRAGLRLDAIEGLNYDPIRDRWFRSPDIAVNYLMMASHPHR